MPTAGSPKTSRENGTSMPAYRVLIRVNGPSAKRSLSKTVVMLPCCRRVVPIALSPARCAAVPVMSMPVAPVSSTNRPRSTPLTSGRISSAPWPSHSTGASGDAAESITVSREPSPSPIATG